MTRADHLSNWLTVINRAAAQIKGFTEPRAVIARGGSDPLGKQFLQLYRLLGLVLDSQAVIVDSLLALELAAGTADLPLVSTEQPPAKEPQQ